MAEFEFSCRAADGADFLYRDGPVIEVCLSAPVALLSYLRDHNLPEFAVISGLATIDTGASMSVVDEPVMKELEIPYLDTIFTGTVHGVAEMKRHNASASFPSLDVKALDLVYAPAGQVRSRTSRGADVIMLLGRDLLQRLTVTYDGPNSRLKIVT